MSRTVLWQVALLVTHPILILLYLLALRAGSVGAGFAPVVAVSSLPLVSALLGVTALRRPEPAPARSRQTMLFGVALLELALSVLAATIVGFAIGLRSL